MMSGTEFRAQGINWVLTKMPAPLIEVKVVFEQLFLGQLNIFVYKDPFRLLTCITHEKQLKTNHHQQKIHRPKYKTPNQKSLRMKQRSPSCSIVSSKAFLDVTSKSQVTSTYPLPCEMFQNCTCEMGCGELLKYHVQSLAGHSYEHPRGRNGIRDALPSVGRVRETARAGLGNTRELEWRGRLTGAVGFCGAQRLHGSCPGVEKINISPPLRPLSPSKST